MTRQQSVPVEAACCPPDDPCGSRTPLAERSLLSFVESVKVMALFKVMANDTRIRLLHHIVRSGEATVTDMAKTLGMKPQAVSNQLMRLSDTGMLSSRREGNNVFYRVVNGCVAPLLDLALCLMEDEGQPQRDKRRTICPNPLKTSSAKNTARSPPAPFPVNTQASVTSPRRSATRPRSLRAFPAESNMGLSCGNPTATANLRPGEVVVDLGSGGGLDVFLAAKKVGPNGKAIGIDMTPEMLDRARVNARSQGSRTSSSTKPRSTNSPSPMARSTASSRTASSTLRLTRAPCSERSPAF